MDNEPGLKPPSRAEQMTFPDVPCCKKVDCRDAPSCEDDLEDICLHGPLMEKIPAEMVRKMILNPGK